MPHNDDTDAAGSKNQIHMSNATLMEISLKDKDTRLIYMGCTLSVQLWIDTEMPKINIKKKSS